MPCLRSESYRTRCGRSVAAVLRVDVCRSIPSSVLSVRAPGSRSRFAPWEHRRFSGKSARTLRNHPQATGCLLLTCGAVLEIGSAFPARTVIRGRLRFGPQPAVPKVGTKPFSLKEAAQALDDLLDLAGLVGAWFGDGIYDGWTDPPITRGGASRRSHPGNPRSQGSLTMEGGKVHVLTARSIRQGTVPKAEQISPRRKTWEKRK
jgi:hypothetical protein